MKREHITLPALQLAAATFFAATALAETYCVDQASKVVATNNCNNAGATGKFSLVKGPLGVALGDVISRSMEVDDAGKGDKGGDDCCDNSCFQITCTSQPIEC
jgi:hypothetical protein